MRANRYAQGPTDSSILWRVWDPPYWVSSGASWFITPHDLGFIISFTGIAGAPPALLTRRPRGKRWRRKLAGSEIVPNNVMAWCQIPECFWKLNPCFGFFCKHRSHVYIVFEYYWICFLVQMLPEDSSDAWYPRGMDRAQRAQRLNCGSRIRGTQKCTGRSNEDHAFCCAQGVRILKPSLWSHKMHRSQHFRQIYIQSLPCFFFHIFSVFLKK